MNIRMSKKKTPNEDEEKEAIRTVQRVLKLSDAEFEKWLDKVERAGLKLKA